MNRNRTFAIATRRWLIGALAAMSIGCSGDEAHFMDCGPGTGVEVDNARYCVYSAELLATLPEPFECPEGTEHQIELEREAIVCSPKADESSIADLPPETCEPYGYACGKSAEELVGAACLPVRVPEGGFDPQSAYFDTRSPGCGLNPCAVYGLDGSTQPSCTSDCASEEAVKERVFCSCVCGSPTVPEALLCACKNGFRCEPLIFVDPDDPVSYCIRDDLPML